LAVSAPVLPCDFGLSGFWKDMAPV
jgi:hypothetical protein